MTLPDVRRVGIIFAGGPAPAANAVITSAALSFLESGREVIGFFHGYSNLQNYHPMTHRLREDEHYRVLQGKDLWGKRSERGIIIGTSRANPGKQIIEPSDLDDPEKTSGLRNVYTALLDMGIDALISIGGDDTLKTANLLHQFQTRLPKEAARVRVVHVPKTIDNDYRGIDFTFGFFTAVDVMAQQVQNLRADAVATSAYYIVETMGRKAGWLAYGVAIAGEANLVLAKEDIDATLLTDDGQHLDPKKLVDRIVDTILIREERDSKFYGTVVLAEGLAEMLPSDFLENTTRDEHGHISLGSIDLGKMVALHVAARYQERTAQKKKVRGVQLGYESRCAPPHAFDLMLGSQLGIGAFRALVEEQLDGHMVSCEGQLDLCFVPFQSLINATTLRAEIRFIEPGSDFHRLARFLETKVDDPHQWSPGRRQEL